MRRMTVVSVAALVAVGTAGCRSRGAATPTSVAATSGPAVSRVLPGDRLQGQLAANQGTQAFYFEGVAYTLFDYDFAASAPGSTSGPALRIEDPEGQPIDLGNGRGAKGIILRRTGTYRGTVAKQPGCGEACYTFQYGVRLANEDERQLYLTPCSEETLSFVATTGANCVVTIRPLHDCNVVPKIVLVKDPDGASALARETMLPGACEPAIDLGRANTRILRFNAAKPGRYTVIVAAEEGISGEAVAAVSVFPGCGGRNLVHDNGGASACAPPPCAPPPCAPPPPAPCGDCAPPPMASASMSR